MSEFEGYQRRVLEKGLRKTFAQGRYEGFVIGLLTGSVFGFAAMLLVTTLLEKI